MRPRPRSNLRWVRVPVGDVFPGTEGMSGNTRPGGGRGFVSQGNKGEAFFSSGSGFTEVNAA